VTALTGVYVEGGVKKWAVALDLLHVEFIGICVCISISSDDRMARNSNN